MNGDVWALKDTSENLNTRKSTSKRILTGILSKNLKNSELKQNSSYKLWRAWRVLDRYGETRINMQKIYDCESNLFPIILLGNQMVYQ